MLFLLFNFISLIKSQCNNKNKCLSIINNFTNESQDINDIKFQQNLIKKSKYFVKYAAAAKCTPNNIINWNCNHYCEINLNKKPSLVFNNMVKSTQMFIKIDDDSRNIILSFRSTKNPLNWMADINIALISAHSIGLKLPIKVHTGFYLSFLGLNQKYINKLKEYSQLYPNYQITFVGHSLGGALASLAMVHAKNYLDLPFDRFQLFTYGQPRVGNQYFANYINENFKIIARYVHKYDPVPRVPIKGKMLTYTHFKNEIYMKKKNNFQICNQNFDEDPNCSSANYIINVINHLYAWDLQFDMKC